MLPLYSHSIHSMLSLSPGRAERKDVLSTFFMMLTLWAYSLYVEKPVISRYLISLIFFIMGLMSKPMLVTLPLVLFLLDYWPLNRFPSTSGFNWKSLLFNTEREYQKSCFADVCPPGLSTLLLEKVPFILFAGFSSIITIFSQKKLHALQSLEVISLGDRVANAFIAYAGYIVKMIVPINLSIFYPYYYHVPLWRVAGACILLILVTVLAVKSIKHKPFFIVGWLWYLGTLVPVIGLVQVGSQAMADRYTYIPLIGLFIVIVWGFSDLTARRHFRKAKIGLAIATISILFVITGQQVRHWRNSITVFEHAIDVTSDNYMSHNNLGYTFVEKQA